jgi:uncharacterized membrane protein
LPPLALLWLAVFFGRTLRRGATPLIERIALVSNPALPRALRRYTRRLTTVWCIYFVTAAVLTATATASSYVSLAVPAATVMLFVGERWVRPWFFPDEAFPGLLQQFRDTWRVWRIRG